MELNKKYLKDAEELFKSGDYSQASEKYWGAAAEITKAYAEKLGRHLRTHNDLWDFVIDLNKKSPNSEILRYFADASHLHSNFYEDDLRQEVIENRAESVKRYINSIKILMKETR